MARDNKLELKAQAGKIYYTLDGSDPRAPGGGVAPNAIHYSATVVLQGTVLVRCRALKNERWSYPAAAKFVVGPAPRATAD